MQTAPRNSAPIRRIYIHTNEGPESENGAGSLVSYLRGQDAGYHVVVDDHNTIVAAGDDQILWSEGGDNSDALALCIIGRAGQSASDWADPYSKAAIERAAQKVAGWCKQYGIPAVRVHPGAPGHAPTDSGIAGHVDDHDPRSEGHTDPGPNFPWDAFLARVNQILAPIDWQALARLAAWANRVKHNPLTAGDTGPDVVIAKQLLANAGYDVGNVKPGFGPLLVEKVHEFKLDHHLPNADGREIGAHVVKALGL